MRIRIDPRHEASARRLRDLYVEDLLVRAVIGLDLAIRRVAACAWAFATRRIDATHAGRTSCRS